MKRTEKYPNTDTFTYYNANPKGRITTDCVVRAVTLATEQPYDKILMFMATVQIETGYSLNDSKGEDKALAELGWVKHKQPKKSNGKKYTGKEFCRDIVKPGTRYIMHIGGHHLSAIVDGKIHDTWDCSDGCIGNYWTKEINK